MRRYRLAFAALAALLSAGCVQTIAESRVQSALIDVGLSPGNADCMAGRMVDRLTIDQLRKLEAMKARQGEPTDLASYVRRVRNVGDAEVISVTASSAALCATGLAQ